jgi:hypothetical protein
MIAINNSVSVVITMLAFTGKSSCLSRTFKFVTCMISEIEITKCPSMSVMHEGGSMKGLCVEAVANDGDCQNFSVEFYMNIPLLKYNYLHCFVD